MESITIQTYYRDEVVDERQRVQTMHETVTLARVHVLRRLCVLLLRERHCDKSEFAQVRWSSRDSVK